MPIYHKKIDKNNKLLLINKIGKNKMNISCDNVKKCINYYKGKENIIINNNNSLILRNIKENIYLNNKDTKIRNIYYPRSPINKSINFKKEISPIKKLTLLKIKNMKINQ